MHKKHDDDVLTCDLPKGIIEIPTSLLLTSKKIKIGSKKYITPIRNILRKESILKRKKGSGLKKDGIMVMRKN